jgi:hypothetical protein
MTIPEAERNLSELIEGGPTKRLYYHYKDLKQAIEELDEEILAIYFNEPRE